jgi:acylphosphatase
MTQTLICQQFIVTGQVQGVSFRAFTAKQARLLHITGWVRNLADGSVEVVGCGQESNLAVFAEQLWAGPALAKVDTVQINAAPWQPFIGFEVKESA